MAGSRPKVALSACLAGENVRYDGREKCCQALLEALQPYVEWLTVCPETGAGLPVPRPPVQLVMQGQRVHALGVEDGTLDVTNTLQDYADSWRKKNNDVSAAVLKARSPSCGYQTTPVMYPDSVQPEGNGLFVQRLRQDVFPLPIIDEEAWFDPSQRARFVRQMMFVWRWQQLPDYSLSAVQGLHARYKYLFMAHHPARCTELGQLLATGQAADVAGKLAPYYQGALELLESAPARNQYVNAFQHMAGYVHSDAHVSASLHDAITAFSTGKAALNKLIAVFTQCVKTTGIDYLQRQVLLHPQRVEQEYVYTTT